MKKKLFSLLCAGLMLTACGQQNKNETTMDFTDDVQVALADTHRRPTSGSARTTTFRTTTPLSSR